MLATVQKILGAVLQKHLSSDNLSAITEVSVTAERIIVGTCQDGVRCDYEVCVIPLVDHPPPVAPTNVGGNNVRCGGCCTAKAGCGPTAPVSKTDTLMD